MKKKQLLTASFAVDVRSERVEGSEVAAVKLLRRLFAILTEKLQSIGTVVLIIKLEDPARIFLDLIIDIIDTTVFANDTETIIASSFPHANINCVILSISVDLTMMDRDDTRKHGVMRMASP